jgi:hypothetical protein
LLLAFGVAATAFAQPKPAPSPDSLIELRRHTELAMARGDYRSAEMLIETFLPAAERLAAPDWHVFNGHLIATRVKLALAKTDEAEVHAVALRAQATRLARSDEAVELAIAEITTALVRRQQGQAEAATTHARRALAILGRARASGRITRQTFESERLAYEAVLNAASSGNTAAAR